MKIQESSLQLTSSREASRHQSLEVETAQEFRQVMRDLGEHRDARAEALAARVHSVKPSKTTTMPISMATPPIAGVSCPWFLRSVGRSTRPRRAAKGSNTPIARTVTPIAASNPHHHAPSKPSNRIHFTRNPAPRSCSTCRIARTTAIPVASVSLRLSTLHDRVLYRSA